MDTQHVTDPGVEQVEEVFGADTNGDQPQNSVLAALRAQRAEAVADKYLDLEVPGWRGLLALRLGPIPAQKFDRIIERVTSSKAPDRLFQSNADTLLNACREVLGRTSRDEEFIVITDEDGEPVRIDERLARLLDLPATSGRGLVRELYGRVQSPELAIGIASGEYADWASSAAADEDYVGES